MGRGLGVLYISFRSSRVWSSILCVQRCSSLVHFSLSSGNKEEELHNFQAIPTLSLAPVAWKLQKPATAALRSVGSLACQLKSREFLYCLGEGTGFSHFPSFQ